MLILIAGITGNMGTDLARRGLATGHQIRGLGRNPSKLPNDISPKLESFICSSYYYDIPALNKACRGVDAVICAYAPTHELGLDAQLLLLRASERAGIKRFHAISWNLDWSKQPLGSLETYDAYISFMTQARITSPIKPLYVFVGALAQSLFGVPGVGAQEQDKALWNKLDDLKRRINVVGTGEEKIQVTFEADAAAFSMALITSDEAEEGGFYQFCSDTFSLKELKDSYEQIKGAKVEWNMLGLTLDVVNGLVDRSRAESYANDTVREKYPEYIGLVYIKYMLNGEMNLKHLDMELFPEVTASRMTLEKYIKTSPYI